MQVVALMVVVYHSFKYPLMCVCVCVCGAHFVVSDDTAPKLLITIHLCHIHIRFTFDCNPIAMQLRFHYQTQHLHTAQHSKFNTHDSPPRRPSIEVAFWTLAAISVWHALLAWRRCEEERERCREEVGRQSGKVWARAVRKWGEVWGESLAVTLWAVLCTFSSPRP